MSSQKTDTVNISTSFPPIQSFSWNADPKGLKYVETESSDKIKKGKKAPKGKKAIKQSSEVKHDTKADVEEKADEKNEQEEGDEKKTLSPDKSHTDCGSPKKDPNRLSTAIPRRPKDGCVSKLTMDILRFRMSDSESFARTLPFDDDDPWSGNKAKELNRSYPHSPVRQPPRRLLNASLATSNAHQKANRSGPGRWADPTFGIPKDQQYWILEDASRKRSLHDTIATRSPALNPTIQSNFIPTDPTPLKDLKTSPQVHQQQQYSHPPAAVVLATTSSSERKSSAVIAGQAVAQAQQHQSQLREERQKHQHKSDELKRQQRELELQMQKERMARAEAMEEKERETLETHFEGQLLSMGSELVELQEKLHRDVITLRESRLRDHFDTEWVFCIEILWRRILRELEFNDRRRIIAALRNDLNDQDVFTHLQIALIKQETASRKQTAAMEAQARTNLLRQAGCQQEELEFRMELRIEETQRRRDQLLALDTALNNFYLRESCREEEDALRGSLALREDQERFCIARMSTINLTESSNRSRIEGNAESEYQQLFQSWGEVYRILLALTGLYDSEQYGRRWILNAEEEDREHCWGLKTILGTESTERLTITNSQTQAFQAMVRTHQDQASYYHAVWHLQGEERSRRALLNDESMVRIEFMLREHTIIEQEFIGRLSILGEDADIRNRVTYERSNAWANTWQRREMENDELTARQAKEKEESVVLQTLVLQAEEISRRVDLLLESQSLWVSLRHAHRILLDGIVVFLEGKHNLLHDEEEYRKSLVTEAMVELYGIYMAIRDEHYMLGLEIRQVEQRKIILAYESEEWEMMIKRPFESQKPTLKAMLRSASSATRKNSSGNPPAATGSGSGSAERRDPSDGSRNGKMNQWLLDWEDQEENQRNLVEKAEAMFSNTIRVTERAERSLVLMAAGAPMQNLKVSTDDFTWALHGVTQREVKARLGLMLAESNARNDLFDRRHIAREGLLPPHTAERRYRASITIQCAWRVYFSKKVVRLLRELRSKQDSLHDKQYTAFMEMLLRKAAMSPSKQSRMEIEMTPAKADHRSASSQSRGQAQMPMTMPPQMPPGMELCYVPMMVPRSQPPLSSSSSSSPTPHTLFPNPDTQPAGLPPATSPYMAYMPYPMMTSTGMNSWPQMMPYFQPAPAPAQPQSQPSH